MRASYPIRVLLAGAAMLAGAAPAWPDVLPDALDLDAANEVLARPRPGLDAEGLQIGSFTLFPALTAMLAFDDNVFDDQFDRHHSAVYSFEPSATLRSHWIRHELDIEAQGDFQRYTSEPQANTENYGVVANGRIDVNGTTAISLNGQYQRGSEAKGSLGDVVVDSAPIAYRNYGGGGALQTRFGLVQLHAGANVDRFEYDDIRIGDVIASQRYRNRTNTSAMGGFGVQVGPSITTFLDGYYDRARYDVRTAGAGLDSSGYRVVGGVDLRFSHLIVGRIGLGFVHRNYADAAFRPFSGLNYSGKVVWNVTTLVTLTFNADKAIVESPQIGVSGVISDHGGARIDWEVLRRLIVSARIDRTTEKYRGEDRRDVRNEGNAVLRYLANRSVDLSLMYTCREQNGHGKFGRSYRENMAMFAVTLQR